MKRRKGAQSMSRIAPKAVADMSARKVSRRRALATAGLGAAGLAVMPGRASAAEWTAAEKANVKVVTDFCAAWPSQDIDKVMSFFADNCAYRVTEAQEPNKGRQAVRDRIQSFLPRVQKFEVLESFAKGPMVFNERIDTFSGGPLKSWRGVGVFFLKDGKIVEWYDYTIAVDRS
jgi:limonene-1,2-epoxide hydrolase